MTVSAREKSMSKIYMRHFYIFSFIFRILLIFQFIVFEELEIGLINNYYFDLFPTEVFYIYNISKNKSDFNAFIKI